MVVTATKGSDHAKDKCIAATAVITQLNTAGFGSDAPQ